MISNNSRSFSFPGKWIVTGILLLSLLLRWILILRGGQYYNSDETRYEVSLAAARLLWQGQVGEALRQFTISPEHLGFKVVGILPALTEHLIGPSLALPAMFFSLFSVLNLYLIFLLAQRDQGTPNEPLYALFLAASCLSLLYYSRHLFPYDMAMSFGLLALYIGLDRNPTTRTSLVCGGLSFLCFITYNGYWPLAGFAMLAHVLMNGKKVTTSHRKRSFPSLRGRRSLTKQHLHWRAVPVSHFQSKSNKLLMRLLPFRMLRNRRPSTTPQRAAALLTKSRRSSGRTARNDEAGGLLETISSMLQKGILTAFGFITPLIIVILAMLRSGTDMISAYQLFATSITQGMFEEGWSIPFEYFWYTDYTIILILGALAFLAIISSFRNKRRYTWLWAGGILFIYLCLLIPSVFEYFVVYARLARQMIPFLVLLSAQGLTKLENRLAYGRRIIQVIFAITFLQAAWNFNAAYRIGFPRDFAAEVQTRFRDFEFSSKRLAYGAPVICRYNGYMIEHTKFYVAPPEELPHVEGQLLLSAPHPTNYQPYLYEGDPPEFRQAYRSLKLRMNFYKADPEFMSDTNPAWTAIESCVAAEE